MLARPRATSAALAALVFLALAASALAWRAPRQSERRAITAAAERAPHAGGSKVTVSRIRVSTVGPWASATLTIYLQGSPDTATDILRKTHGSWRSVSVGTSGEWCAMPRADQVNLGFGHAPPCAHA
jgi:hypothetical protein